VKTKRPVETVAAILCAFAAAIGFVSSVAKPAANNSLVTVANCGVYDHQPARLTIACGDGNDYLESLHWAMWSAAAAKGHGVEQVNDCDPYCAAGKFHSYPVSVTLDEVESSHFTRLRLHYSGARPPRTPQDVERKLIGPGHAIR
jgi:hypothetical protein